MDQLTHAQLGRLRLLLEHQRRALETTLVERLQGQGRIAAAMREGTALDRDERDSAVLREMNFATTDHEVVELAEVRAALGRLDCGTYGVCLGCGETVPVDRLLAQPAALRCVECQGEHERVRASHLTRPH